ncbi:MAG: OsmC family protein [Gemmatimonadales bacterium]
MKVANKRAVRLEWCGSGLRFRGGGTVPETPTIEVDGDGESAPSPMLVLLLACAGCTASDVISMLQKMRVVVASLTVDVTGERREGDPQRYSRLKLFYRIAGDGLDLVKARRAVVLSLEKYCSVVHSLAPDIVVDHEIELA